MMSIHCVPLARRWPMMYGRPRPDLNAEPFGWLYDRGVRLMIADAACGGAIMNPHLASRPRPEAFDHAAMEREWSAIVDRCPEARLCLRMEVCSPRWWDEAHPAELQQYHDGRVEHDLPHTDRRTVPSLASLRWREEAAVALDRLLDWLDASGWAERVWGIHLCHGITFEWGILGSDEFVDYSDPMRRYFRQWLRRACGGDVDRLRERWGRHEVDFDTAGIPTKDERLRGDGAYRELPRDRPAFDFQRCLSDANADYLLHLAGHVRRRRGERYLLGAFYGYTLSAREFSRFAGRHGPGGLHGGQHALRRVLDSRLIDFLCSPYLYVNRDLGAGVLGRHQPLASVRAGGVHFYEENDLRPHATPDIDAAMEEDRRRPMSVGITTAAEASVRHQQLAIAQSLAEGTTGWWYDLVKVVADQAAGSFYGDPKLLDELGRLHALYQDHAGTGTPARIALVIDEAAKDVLDLRGRVFLDEVYEQLPAWTWCGAPVDILLASDATADRMKPRRLVYVFAPYLSRERRHALADALCRDGRHVWWSADAGHLTDHGADHEAFAALTGFDRPVRRPGPPVMIERHGWCSWCGPCAGLGAVQIAAIARAAGVPLYAEPPVQVMAREGLVAMHVRHGGCYQLALPDRDRAWRDLVTGRIVIDDCFEFEEHGVAVFLAE